MKKLNPLTTREYLAGLQCPRKLWLDLNSAQNERDQHSDFAAHLRQILRMGAQSLFPGAIDISQETSSHAEAVALTCRLLQNQGPSTILNARIIADGVSIHFDIMQRQPARDWAIVEIKTSASVKSHHCAAATLKAYALDQINVRRGDVCVLHVNTNYRLAAGGIAWDEFFTRSDVTEEVDVGIADVEASLVRMREIQVLPEAPAIDPGPHCSTPFGCGHFTDCSVGKPADWVFSLPRFGQAKIDTLRARGIEAISAIPLDFPLTAQQARIRDVIVHGTPYIAPTLGAWLRPFGPPAFYLDFEAMASPIPLYEGLSPYQTIPFQWSLHLVDADGSLHHEYFLADGNCDPRREFAETLIAALAPSDIPIIVYSPYEQTQLRKLSHLFPDLKADLESIIFRLADLLPLVRDGVYLREFGGSFSIKSVGPALCPDFTYDDLDDVADGLAAADSFLQLAFGYISNTEAIAEKRSALLAYCKRDTLAMVKVHEALRRLATK